MTDDDKPQPYDAAITALVVETIRAKARVAALLMAAAVGTFVYFVADAGRPLWLVLTIGVFGAILIAFFIALVWFWLNFFKGRDRP